MAKVGGGVAAKKEIRVGRSLAGQKECVEYEVEVILTAHVGRITCTL